MQSVDQLERPDHLATIAQALLDFTKRNNLKLADNQELWEPKDIAAYIKQSTDHVRNQVVSKPDFPARVKNVNSRWIKSEVIEYFTARD